MKKGILILLMLLVTSTAQGEITVQKIIDVESSGNPRAISKKNCRGLMQMSAIAWLDVQGHYPELKKYSFKRFAYDPEINVLFGTRYLKIIKTRYLKNRGTDKDILICYHDGPGNWRAWKGGRRSLGPEMSKHLRKFGMN